MGRGRQKAKDAKIARQLKYSTPDTDLAALERELVSGSSTDDEPEDNERYGDRWNDDEQ